MGPLTARPHQIGRSPDRGNSHPCSTWPIPLRRKELFRPVHCPDSAGRESQTASVHSRNPGAGNKSPPISFELPTQMPRRHVDQENASHVRLLSSRPHWLTPRSKSSDNPPAPSPLQSAANRQREPDFSALRPSAAARNGRPARPSQSRPPTRADFWGSRE